MTQQEIWKPIADYEGLYEVSNMGRVKSLERIKMNRGLYPTKTKEKILKLHKDGGGYKFVSLFKNNRAKIVKVHKLVAICFLNHKPNGMKSVIDHKNFVRTDNRVENLRIITQRKNSSLSHLKSSSKYIGVCWHKGAKKWRSQIFTEGKRKHLGYYENEYDAHLSYEKALREIDN